MWAVTKNHARTFRSLSLDINQFLCFLDIHNPSHWGKFRTFQTMITISYQKTVIQISVVKRILKVEVENAIFPYELALDLLVELNEKTAVKQICKYL